MKILILILIQIIFFSCLYFLDNEYLKIEIISTIYSVSTIYLLLDILFKISIKNIIKSNLFFVMFMVFTVITFISTLITLFLYIFSNSTIEFFIFNLIIFIFMFLTTLLSGYFKSN